MNHLSTLLNTSRILASSLLVFGLASAVAQASRAIDLLSYGVDPAAMIDSNCCGCCARSERSSCR